MTEGSHVGIDTARDSVVVNPLIDSRLTHLDEHETVTQVSLDAIAETLGAEVGSTEHNATLGHVVVTNTALVDDRGKHVLDELRSLGDLVKHHEDRSCAIDT